MTTSDFSPKPHDLILVRGDTLEQRFRFGMGEQDAECNWTLTEGYDLTGVVFASQMWDAKNIEKIADFEVVLDDQTDEDTKGAFWVRASTEVTEELPLIKGRWDLEATWPGGRVKTYLAGACTVKADTTRD